MTKRLCLGIALAATAIVACGGGSGSSGGGPGGASAAGGGGSSQAGGQGPGAGGGQQACTPGEKKACYDGPAGTEGVGVCKAGHATCRADGSGFGPCEGEVRPKKEDCATPEDDDCDGVANQASAGCVCTPGDTQPCYDGAMGTKDVGLCHGGTQTCADDGTSWGDCAGEVTPTPEDCSMRGDEDCDGTACSDAIWDRVFGDAQAQEVRGVAIDDANETFVLGTFQGTVDFGGGPVTSMSNDVYLAKYDPTGALLWVKTFRSNVVNPLLVGPSVNAGGYVAIGGTVSSGALHLGATSVTVSSGDEQGFAALLGPDGTPQWVHQVQSTSGNQVEAVALDAQNDVYLGGGYGGALTCSNGTCATSAQTALNPFLRKLDSTGNYAYTRAYGGAGGSVVSIGLAPDGTAVATGVFFSTVMLHGTTYTSVGSQDAFVTAHAPDGTPLFNFVIGTPGPDSAKVAVRPDGSFVLAGYVGGPISLGAVSIPAEGPYVASFDSTTAAQWAKSLTSTPPAGTVGSVAVDAAGDVVIAGSFAEGTIDLGDGPRTNGSNYSDAFLAKYAVDGAFRWAKAYGGPGHQMQPAAAMTSQGRVAYALDYQNQIDFGLGAHTSSNIEGQAQLDVAVVNLEP
ncbi:MAG TPA: hypothetical protein VHB21_15465 [Minicystis sp.]|nr:hypothetical protein [Minicystis sp.]